MKPYCNPNKEKRNRAVSKAAKKGHWSAREKANFERTTKKAARQDNKKVVQSELGDLF